MAKDFSIIFYIYLGIVILTNTLFIFSRYSVIQYFRERGIELTISYIDIFIIFLRELMISGCPVFNFICLIVFVFTWDEAIDDIKSEIIEANYHLR